MPNDSTRLEELQIVRKVRETVRRWWGIELSFTDAKGYVLDHGKGIIIPPQNRICTACLGDKEGLRRCNQSIEKARARMENGTGLVGPCHRGLEIIGTPIEFGGVRQGSVFACGFLVEEKSDKARPRAMDEVKALSLPVLQPEAAFETIQRIEAREVPRLADLMDTTVEEIDAYHDAVALREKRISDLQDELVGRYRFADIIGKSEPMRRVYARLCKAGESHVPRLIPRGSGTRQETIARALRLCGARRTRQVRPH